MRIDFLRKSIRIAADLYKVISLFDQAIFILNDKFGLSQEVYSNLIQ
jgi:hypothetical protein